MNRAGWWVAALVAMAVCELVWAAEEESAPEAEDMTFVEEEAGEAPASPFAGAGDPGAPGVRKDAVPGWVELSSGAKVAGRIYTTRGKRLKIYNVEKEIYEYVPVPAVRQIEAMVEWERMEKEWRFKEPGNPEKVYSGREYPARKLAYRLTLVNGHVITGHIPGQPMYIARLTGGEEKVDRFVLHDRQKGEMGTSLEDLVYVKRVGMHEEGQQATGNGQQATE